MILCLHDLYNTVSDYAMRDVAVRRENHYQKVVV